LAIVRGRFNIIRGCGSPKRERIHEHTVFNLGLQRVEIERACVWAFRPAKIVT